MDLSLTFSKLWWTQNEWAFFYPSVFFSHNLIYIENLYSHPIMRKTLRKKNFLILRRKKITDLFWILKNMGENISPHDPHLKSVSLNFEKHGREYLSPWSPLKRCFLGNTSKCGLHHIVSKNILNNQIIK